MILIRFLDVIFSLGLLLPLLFLLAPVAVLLRLTGEGKVFYLQQRVGRFEHTFNIIKFATMLENSPKLLTGNLTVKNDPRVLPVGRLLRSSKVNELPQVINIVKGDMGFVGYRPVTKDHWDLYPKNIRMELKQYRPGLTGLGSLVFRNEEQLLDTAINPEQYFSETIAPKKAALELWYARNASVYLWFLIIALTAIVVCLPNINISKFLPKEAKKLVNVGR